MIPGLLVTEGPQRGIYVQFEEKKPFWLGRADSCNLVLANDPTISGKHCCFVRNGSQLEMLDESRNGTRLNGRKIHHNRVLLKNADILCLGNSHLQVVNLDRSHKKIEYNYQTCMEDVQKRRSAKEKIEMLEGIGPYLNIEIIGSGAFGTVYKSIHESLKQLVALKVSLEDLEPQFIKRFLREADLLKKLTHDYIIHLYDKGIFEIDGENRIYIALEYFQGVNLNDHVRSHGPLPWQKIFKIFYQLISALEYMHSQGVLHRDLKPDNVMYNDIQEVAKIIDLGLGKSILAEERKTFFTTKPNSTLGTPNFMPIEQWGDVKDADERSDIYSLGATLYFLLSGQPPYGKHKEIEALYELVINQKLTPLEELCMPNVPKGFLKIVKKMMEFEPEDRYPSIPLVLQDFEQLVSNLS